jgi:hypothetical protein
MPAFKSKYINRHFRTSYFFATGFVLATISTAAFAADRVIEDSLVYKDPTVAHRNQIVEGISLDYFSFAQNLIIPNAPNPDMTGTLTYLQPGISGFVGSGDFTVMASYRSGTGTANVTAPINGVTYTMNDSFTRSEYELDLRWLMTNYQTTYFTPYALIGYAGSTMSQTITIASLPQFTYSADNSTTAPLIGVGGIIPMSEKIGFRIDEKFGFVTDTSAGVSNNYNQNRLTTTMYYNFADSWNGQLGYRFESYTDGSPSIVGGYAMLGYTFR